MNPARKLRWELFPPDYSYRSISQIPEDFDFSEYEEKLYTLCIKVKDSEERELENNPERSKTTLFIYYVGLFCFGHIEVLERIIDYFPLVPRPIKTMVVVLRQLLPLPPDIGINTPNLLKKWVYGNKDKLKWSEAKGKYLLKLE